MAIHSTLVMFGVDPTLVPQIGVAATDGGVPWATAATSNVPAKATTVAIRADDLALRCRALKHC